ncbi:ABC-2 type transport system ATP-binding protein [Methanosarcina thermophila]|jgi:ABC-2 type transport system ATP-binding protein|uniref:ABC-2 type transport system ATP-binding protein n=1 Tax=Methanosarcina thermophila TaxID=2210 RepID=A0A1I6X1L6_METTE|nr:ABC transporter ATP-binding protein [Methanosarcina thermophila]ALK04807.1 MAG: ABC transporter ATP-binding protein [Methanosarcina sp. 795]NLU56594.1 ABC transporter ATP-binding protein [Methanosarcina thermophila]SFT32072.1 ABC-2 type transport system ATP-binding protein [Methanosarcina thermophila]HOA67560.1 ABC transporter ATP-binding protein [Methanosarcina thermophila]HOQ64730.1 ABC transporter ATP-binding protein [Methanosarcina thermophila]
MHTVEFQSVSKSFSEKSIVKDISFSIRQGEIFGLLGPNGAGKTTLIRLLLDIIKPDTGKINVFGELLNPAAKNRIGYLPEERGLYRKTGLLEMLVYLAQLKGMPKKQAHLNAESLLKSLDFYQYKNKKVEELSKGMQQQIQFLSAIIHDPELIILDEPFSGLDPVNTKIVKNKILDLRAAGKTVILSTHMMEQAQTLCNRILMLNKGRRVLYGTVEEIRREHGRNSLIVEFAEKEDLNAIREISGIKKITESGKLIEIFPETGINTQILLEELVRRANILRFEQALPSLNDIFIETLESALNE